MTLIQKESERLFQALYSRGLLASVENQDYGSDGPMDDEQVKRLIGGYLRSFLTAHWPDVQIMDMDNALGKGGSCGS